LVALPLVALAVAVDASLLLKTGGAVLRPIEAVGLAVATAVAIGLTRWAPRHELIGTPVLGFLVFELSLGRLIAVPDDAVIRDAQAGLAVAVTVGGQAAVVAVGLGLGRYGVKSSGSARR
jgi:hypothetical protein